MNKEDLRKAKKNGEMTDAIVNKAKENGYAGGYTWKQFGDLFFYKPLGSAHGYCLPLGSFLFDHTFAKAFWGEEYPDSWCEKYDVSKEEMSRVTKDHKIPIKSYWKWQLQQAVLSEDPLLYYFERL